MVSMSSSSTADTLVGDEELDPELGSPDEFVNMVSMACTTDDDEEDEEFVDAEVRAPSSVLGDDDELVDGSQSTTGSLSLSVEWGDDNGENTDELCSGLTDPIPATGMFWCDV